MRAIEVVEPRAERRQSAVAEIREHLTRLYRGFVGWASMYVRPDPSAHNVPLRREAWQTELAGSVRDD